MKKLLSGMIILTMVIMLFTAVGYAAGAGNINYVPRTETEVTNVGQFYSLKTYFPYLYDDANVIFAAYKDGLLCKVDQRELKYGYFSYSQPEYFEIFNIEKNVDYVKIFVFSDLDSITPLCEPEVIGLYPIPPYHDKVIVVDEVDTDECLITSKMSKGIRYKNSDSNINAVLYNRKGEEMDWADLKEWDVVSYSEWISNTGTTITAYLVNGAVTGKVTEVGDNVAFINGKEYEINENYLDDGEISLGDEGVFYTDAYGKIVYFVKSENDEQIGNNCGTLAVQVYTNQALDSNGNSVDKLYAFTDCALNSYTVNFSGELPSNGSAFEAKLSYDKSAFTEITPLVTVNGNSIELNPSVSYNSQPDADGMTYIFGDMAKVTGPTGSSGGLVTLKDDRTFGISSDTPVYVVDRRINDYKKRVMRSHIKYLKYDYKDNVFYDLDEVIDNYMMFARCKDGIVIDVVLYVNFEIE